MTSIEPLYDKQCTCLLCGTDFTTKKIRIKFVKVLNLDSDFSPTYADSNNPLFYYVHICPACGFSFHEESTPKFSFNEKMLLIEKVCNQWTPRSFGSKRSLSDAITSYKLATYCATLREEKHVLIGGLYIRLAWIYRSILEKNQENRFLLLALQEYEASYMTGDYKGTIVSELKTMYLIGELARRTGQISKAIKYFSLVIEQQTNTIEPNIIHLAKEGWSRIKEFHQT
ncbi:DUF2225 domain-containing protein [Niallia nealsonii]|uniref:DUF2225 domain-containing protein n=1 Tax=Niallia nealsonii TaxID=115979 RepID=A0A2N0Z269_9BACI|nr:DUF2225 domain-containing protein [Niallia nealsonii]PKG23613.1 DUF2225 domain-containing protein [Niallia nealsonii]